MKEMAYTPSQKDLTETRIHHMLSENLFMPRARVSGAGERLVLVARGGVIVRTVERDDERQ